MTAKTNEDKSLSSKLESIKEELQWCFNWMKIFKQQYKIIECDPWYIRNSTTWLWLETIDSKNDFLISELLENIPVNFNDNVKLILSKEDWSIIKEYQWPIVTYQDFLYDEDEYDSDWDLMWDEYFVEDIESIDENELFIWNKNVGPDLLKHVWSIITFRIFY